MPTPVEKLVPLDVDRHTRSPADIEGAPEPARVLVMFVFAVPFASNVAAEATRFVPPEQAVPEAVLKIEMSAVVPTAVATVPRMPVIVIAVSAVKTTALSTFVPATHPIAATPDEAVRVPVAQAAASATWLPFESILTQRPDVCEPVVVTNAVVFPETVPTVGVAPAPPPITGRFAVSAPDDASVPDAV